MHGSSSPGHSAEGYGHGVGHGKGGVGGHGMFDFPIGHSGHGGFVTDQAIAVAHDLTTSHDSPHGYVDHSTGGHGNFSAPEGNLEGNGPSFDAPITVDRRTFVALAVGIGYCDWERDARNILESLDLVECKNLQPPNPLVPVQQTYMALLAENFKSPELKVINPVLPRGIYPGATGDTTLWRVNFQIGQRAFGLFGGKLSRKTGVRTYIEIEIIDWSYRQAGDNYVRVVVRVINGSGAELWQHLEAANKFCKAMLNKLTAAKPSQKARDFRKQLASASQ